MNPLHHAPMPGDELAAIRPRVTRAPPGLPTRRFLPLPPPSYEPPTEEPEIAPGMFRTPVMPKKGGGNGYEPR